MCTVHYRILHAYVHYGRCHTKMEDCMKSSCVDKRSCSEVIIDALKHSRASKVIHIIIMKDCFIHCLKN